MLIMFFDNEPALKLEFKQREMFPLVDFPMNI